MKIDVFYIHPTVKPEIYDPLANICAKSMWNHKSGFENYEVERVRTDETKGKDIGAYIRAAHLSDADIMVCLGSHVRINQDGWLNQIAWAFEQMGPGLYGPFGTMEPIPHLRTTAFWCHPPLLRDYPWKVETDQERYNFELDPHRSISTSARSIGLPVCQVTNQFVSHVLTPDVPMDQLLMLDRFTDMALAAK